MIARFGDLFANIVHRSPKAPAVTFRDHTSKLDQRLHPLPQHRRGTQGQGS